MPKFEIRRDENPDAPLFQRGRTAADAVTRALSDASTSLSTGAGEVEVEETPDERGWMIIRLNGKIVGRIRDHAARMRFRRD